MGNNYVEIITVNISLGRCTCAATTVGGVLGGIIGFGLILITALGIALGVSDHI